MSRAVQLTAPLAHHGEGPYWDSARARLLLADVFAPSILSVSVSGAVDRYAIPSYAATVIRGRVDGGFIIGTEAGLLAADESLRTFSYIAQVCPDSAVRTNDGGCDPLGGFVIGTMAHDEAPLKGAVYRISPDHSLSLILSPVTIANGIQWSADGDRAFFIDTPTQRVDVFNVDPETGAWTHRRPFVDLANVPGVPDGMAIDENDGLWIAMWGGGVVIHCDRAGKLVETVTVPGVSRVSSCAFGGEDNSWLFITTSRQGLEHNGEVNAGAVFVYETSSRGAPLARFAG